MALLHDHIVIVGPRSAASGQLRAALAGDSTAIHDFADIAAFLAAADAGEVVAHCAILTGLESWEACREGESEIRDRRALGELPVVLHVDSRVLRNLDDWDRRTPIVWHRAEAMVSRSAILAAAKQYRRMLALEREARRRGSAIATLTDGAFTLRTLDQAECLAALLSQAGPDPDKVSVGLLELFVNAIEHGNLGLGYQRKSDLIDAGTYEETIDELLRDPAHAEKTVEVRLRRGSDTIEFEIEDQGAGFDAEPFLTFDPKRAMATHGRGIASARMLFFDEVSYLDRGNRVIARKFLPKADAEADGGAVDSRVKASA